MLKLPLLIVLSCWTWAAYAQPFYYESMMPDGRRVIGDKPAPGAKSVKQIPLRAGNISAPLSTPAQAPAPGSAADQAAGGADAEVRSAQQELDAAKASLEAGKEPLPGERIGTAGGASRLNDAYFQRQKALEETVASAQKRLDHVIAQRKAAR